jgi:ankyrin repeat protein
MTKGKCIKILYIILISFLFFLSLFIYIQEKGFIDIYQATKVHEQKYKDKLSQSELFLVNAVLDNNTEKIKKELKKRIDIIQKSYSNENFYSILHFAIQMQKYESAKQLLECGYNPNIQDSSGETPLFLAADDLLLCLTLRYYPENITYFIDLLLDFGASPDIVDNQGVSPLIESTEFFQDYENKIARHLVEKGKCNIDLLDKDGHAAVYYALKNEDVYLAHYLIVDRKVNIKNDDSLCVLLRKRVYSSGSKREALRQEIIQEFERQGIDY